MGRPSVASGDRHVELEQIFPLLPFSTPSGLCTSGRSKAARLSRRVTADVSLVIQSLNWYAGPRGSADARPRKAAQTCLAQATPIQQRVTARIVDLVLPRHAVKIAIPSGRSAFMELMRGRTVYDEDKPTGANVERYLCVDGVSLSETVAGALFLDRLLPSFMQIFWRMRCGG